MPTHILRALLSTFVFFCLVLPAWAAPDSVSGWIEIRGQRVALKFVFAAVDEDISEGPGKERVEVLLSDVPLPPELRKANDKWSFWAAEQASEGALHGVILYIDPVKKTWNRGQLLGKQGMEFYSQSVSSPEMSDFVFTPAAAGANEIAGKTVTKKPRRTVMESEGPWSLEAEFRVAITQRPAITATLTGAAAAASPQYKAVLAYLQAGRKKDLEAIKKTMSSEAVATLSKMMERGGTQAALNMFAEQSAETLKLKLSKVIVRGDSAAIEFISGPSGQVTMSTVLENGVWKIGQ